MAKPGNQSRFTLPKSLPVQYRHLEIRQEWINEKARTVDFSISSTTPIERWYGIEILSHDQDAIDTKRILSGGALLENHDWEKQIGVIEKLWVEKAERAHARARFSKHEPRAEIVWGDVVDEIRRNVSIGYLPNEWDILNEDEENELPTILVTRWELHEVSVVSVPADYSVGFGRDQDDSGRLYEVRLRAAGASSNRQYRQQRRPMATRSNTDPAPTNPPNPGGEPSPAAPPTTEPTPSVEVVQAQRDERKRVSAILSMGHRFNCAKEAQRAIDENRPLADFMHYVLTEKCNAQPVTGNQDLGLSNREVREYSIVKAIRELSDVNAGPRLTGLELEASQAMAKVLKREPKGFFLPPEVTRGPATRANQATGVTLPAGTTGGQLVPTDFVLPLIDYLRNWLVVKQAGARLLTGLAGNVVIPKHTGGTTAQWLTEIGPVQDQDLTFSQIALTPKRLSAMSIYSRQLVIQSSPDIEALVRDDLGKSMAQQLDWTALFGSGVAPYPRGIINQAGINRFSFGTDPLYPGYVSAIVALDDSKISISNGAWIANAGCWGAGISQPRFEYTGITVITEPAAPAGGSMGGILLGYPYYKTQQIPSPPATYGGFVFFGNWSDLLIGQWDGTEVTVDPFTLMQNAQIRVAILEFADLNVRYPEAFAVSTDDGYGGGAIMRRLSEAKAQTQKPENGPPGLGQKGK
jgi:HK97 family phage major capsid protein